MNKKSNIEYKEWSIIPLSYYQIIKRGEAIFEIWIPVVISLLCTLVYILNEKTIKALAELASVIPTVSSILIGFTVMLITILLTSSSNSIDELKKKSIEKKLNNSPVSLYQALHIEFCFILLKEVALLILVLFYSFLSGITVPNWISYVFLFTETELILSILLAIIRAITNLYFSFWNNKGDK